MRQEKPTKYGGFGGAALRFGLGGQLAGMGLMSFGADAVIQKATTGEVDWSQAAMSGVIGMVGGGAGMLAGKVAGRVLTNPAAREVAANVVDGAVSGGADYMTSPGPHAPSGFIGVMGWGQIPTDSSLKVSVKLAYRIRGRRS